jgi:hypothetical protein
MMFPFAFTFLQPFRRIAMNPQFASLADLLHSGPNESRSAALSVPPVPTGVPYVDDCLDGGLRAGEVGAVLSVSGGGKSALGMQAAVGAARWLSANDPGRAVFWLNAADGLGPWLWPLSRANAATVDRATLMWGLPLSDCTSLKDYEKSLCFGSDAPGLQGERERLETAERWLGPHLRYDELRLLGPEYDGVLSLVPSVIGTLTTAMAIARKRPRLVVIGPILLPCWRLFRQRDLKGTWAVTRMLERIADECRQAIAVPCDCTVLLVHGLWEGVKRKSGILHSDYWAAWSRKFGASLDFAFVLGTMQHAHQECLLRCTRAFRAGCPKPAIVVRLDGRFGRFEDVTTQFEVDHRRQELVPVNRDQGLCFNDPAREHLDLILYRQERERQDAARRRATPSA